LHFNNYRLHLIASGILEIIVTEATATFYGAIITAAATLIGIVGGLFFGAKQFSKQQKLQQSELLDRQEARRQNLAAEREAQQNELISQQVAQQNAMLVQQKAAVLQQEIANQRPFLEKQLELYFLASETVSTLATEFDRQKWERARSIFWQLYWGQLSLVEEPDVELRMVEIGKMVPKSPEASLFVPISSLERPSLDFAHMMRELIAKNWKVSFVALTEGQQTDRPETTEGPGPKSSR
jgi:hypothetical protein